nr:60S ribosomal protein L15-like [Globicephala melas]
MDKSWTSSCGRSQRPPRPAPQTAEGDQKAGGSLAVWRRPSGEPRWAPARTPGSWGRSSRRTRCASAQGTPRAAPQLSALCRPAPRRPDKTRLGCEAKQGYVMHRLACGTVAANARSLSVPATYGTPVHHGVHPLRFARSLPSAAEELAGRRSGARRVLKPYWVGEDSTYGSLEVVLIDPFHKAKRRNPDTQWITTPVHKHRAAPAGREGHRVLRTTGGSRRAAWRRHSALQLHRYH